MLHKTLYEDNYPARFQLDGSLGISLRSNLSLWNRMLSGALILHTYGHIRGLSILQV